jgi:AcrR family transcriptional regulator
MTPAKPRPRTRPPEERRAQLMNAAERLFLEHGVDATAVEQITAAAGVAKGTFYLHFASKEAICAALGQRFGERLLAGIQTAIAEKDAADWRGRLTAWAGAAIAGYLESIRLHDILFYGSRPPTREGLTSNVVIDHLAGLLQAGATAGAWSVDDPRFAAVFIFSGFHGVVDAAYSAEKRVNRGRLTQRLGRLCFRAVGLPTDPP